MHVQVLLTFSALLFLTVDVSSGSNLLVNLPTGKVEGHAKKTDKGTVYAAFEGIPYARAPVGKHRFEEPKPVKPWYGTWQAKTLTKCMQYYHYTTPGDDWVVGDEDCLHVNVYAPENFQQRSLPVIVFIHGGAFMFNSGGSYGERFLMERDVVYVTFNYRLGPLGFLSTGDQTVSGNAGLRDQALALKWIKEYVPYFGGNAEQITLTGMSAGGASVHIHTLSPLTKGGNLFNRAIAQSGTALNPWVLTENSREKAVRLGQLVGCPTYDLREMVKCMKYRPAKQIVANVKEFQPWLYNPFSPFGVVVDAWSPNPVLPEHPYHLLKKKGASQVPIIFSNVESEGLYPAAEFASAGRLKELDDRWGDLMPFVLDYNNTVKAEEIAGVSEAIRKFYFGDAKVGLENFPAFVQMVSDRLFISDIERAARMHAAGNPEPTYYYFYAYRAANSKSDARTGSKKNYGVSHGDDTIMVLSTNINTTSTQDDINMSNILQSMWLTFAKTGVPNIGDAKWDPVSNNLDDPLKYLLIESPSDVRMQSAEYLANRRNFWDTLPIAENTNIPITRDEL